MRVKDRYVSWLLSRILTDPDILVRIAAEYEKFICLECRTRFERAFKYFTNS